MKFYVAGAFIEQHQRARPMMAKLREAGHQISHDWTQAEGEGIPHAVSLPVRCGAGDSAGIRGPQSG